MKFTFLALVPPLVLAALHLAFGGRWNELSIVSVIAGIWFWLGFLLVPVYWTARVARRAWRDGARHS